MRTHLTKTRLGVAVSLIVLAVPAAALATHVFDDVDDERFFADPVEWAAENDITTGTTETTFEPDRGVTRGESVTFLKRYHDNVVVPLVPARYHAFVDATGGTDPGTSEGISVVKGAAGIFEVEFPPSDIRGCAWQATIVLGSQDDSLLIAPTPPSGEVTIGQDFDPPGGPAIGVAVDADSILVRTWDSAGAAADRPFHLSIEC